MWRNWISYSYLCVVINISYYIIISYALMGKWLLMEYNSVFALQTELILFRKVFSQANRVEC